jgi:hypothetical protein
MAGKRRTFQSQAFIARTGLLGAYINQSRPKPKRIEFVIPKAAPTSPAIVDI